MDTSQNQYGNILSALGAQVQNSMGQATGKLTMQQEADNYNMFSELMKKGVSLPELLGKLDTLEAKVKAMEENPNQSKINQELFEVMEASVKGDATVKAAKQKLADVKSDIITEICLRDPRYKEAYDGYRTAVNSAYVHQKEQSPEREGDPSVCSDPEGCVPSEEGDASGEEDPF